VVVPRVFTALTAEAATEQVLPVVPDIIRLLTVGGEDAELAEAVVEVDDTDKEESYTFSGLNAVDALDAFNSYFLSRDFSDGYPVHPPTPELVDEIIKALGLPADELILTVPPAHGHGTVAKIAANAAMAGGSRARWTWTRSVPCASSSRCSARTPARARGSRTTSARASARTTAP
jgi:hypothetical protein